MTYPTQHGMIGPDGEIIFVAGLQLPGVMKKIFLPVSLAKPQVTRKFRVELPDTALNILCRNQGIGWRMFSLFVDQEQAVKNLGRLVRVQRRTNFRNHIQITIDELA